MDKPKYGEANQSISRLSDKFVKTNSNDKPIGVEVDSFNWDEDLNQRSPSKINLGQYDEEEEKAQDHDNYEDDFEDVVKSNDSTPKKSQRVTPQKPGDKKQPPVHQFTEEEEEIMDEYELADEELKMSTKQKQVKEINDLIEQATNLCLR